MLENLKRYNIVLASKSPRRQELLKGIGLPFSILTKEVDESYSLEMPVFDVAPFLSYKKAKAFEENELPDNYMVITADTVVIVGDKILASLVTGMCNAKAVSLVANMTDDLQWLTRTAQIVRHRVIRIEDLFESLC